jgi:predicted CoA-binding protein
MSYDVEMIKDILLSTKTIATVGLSKNKEKVSNGVASYLQSQGYRVIPVNPTVDEILGEKSYPNLESIPIKIDAVQIFRRSEDVPGAKVVWMQEGVYNEEAAQIAKDAGLQVVMDMCMRAAHQYIFR